MNLTSYRFIRFILVGGFNTFFGTAVFYILYYLTENHIYSALISSVIAIFVGHALTGRLVFGITSGMTLVRYILYYTVLAVTNAVIIDACNRMGISPYIGQLISIPFIVVLSYVVSDNFIFRRPVRK